MIEETKDAAIKKKYMFVLKNLFLSSKSIKEPNFGKKYILPEAIIKLIITPTRVVHRTKKESSFIP